jgi:hypothetical protein
MQKAEQILQAVRKLGEKRLPLTRVYRCLFSEDLLLAAYAKIYRNQGALTPGVDNDTADGMSIERIRRIIAALRDERFYFRPSRRITLQRSAEGHGHSDYRISPINWCRKCSAWCWKPTTNRASVRVPTDSGPDEAATLH